LFAGLLLLSVFVFGFLLETEMRQHYKPEPRRRPLWDLLTALLLGIWFAIFAAAYFDILTY
jgi:H+/Cl- antiporter ClcA